MATLDQHRESLDPKSTLAEALTGGRGDHVMVGGKTQTCRQLHEGLPVRTRQMRTPAGGALRRRNAAGLMLARALAKPSNLLVLDAPPTISTSKPSTCSKKWLGDYDGTVILISHAAISSIGSSLP